MITCALKTPAPTTDFLQLEFEAYLAAVHPHATRAVSERYHELRNAFHAGAYAALKDAFTDFAEVA